MFFAFIFFLFVFYLTSSNFRYWWSYLPPYIIFYNYRYDDGSILLSTNFKTFLSASHKNSIVTASSFPSFFSLAATDCGNLPKDVVMFGSFISDYSFLCRQRKRTFSLFHFSDFKVNNCNTIYFYYIVSDNFFNFSFPIAINANFAVPNHMFIKIVNKRMYTY